jgi:uncharacterized short protein YbdD (DUF466 family)
MPSGIVKSPIHTNVNNNISLKSIKLYNKEYSFFSIKDKTYILIDIEENNQPLSKYLVCVSDYDNFVNNYKKSSKKNSINPMNMNNNVFNKNYIKKIMIIEENKVLNIDDNKYIIKNIEFTFNNKDIDIILYLSGKNNGFLSSVLIETDLKNLSKYIKIANKNS